METKFTLTKCVDLIGGARRWKERTMKASEITNEELAKEFDGIVASGLFRSTNYLFREAAARLRKMDKQKYINKDVRKLGDPWESREKHPRTILFEDGTFAGDGKDLIACRDIVHDLYELWFGKEKGNGK